MGSFFREMCWSLDRSFGFAEFDGLGLDENDFGLTVGVILEGYIFEIQ
jgi:hypothetical protein